MAKNKTSQSKQTKGEKKKPLIFMGFSALLLILFGTGYFVYSNLNQKKSGEILEPEPYSNNTRLTSTPTLANNTIPIPTIDPYEGWFDYSSEEVPFTFKFTEEMIIKESNSINLSLWGPTQKKDTEFFDGIVLNFSLPFKIEEQSLKDYANKKLVESQEYGEIIAPLEEIQVGQLTGYTFTLSGLGEFKYIFVQSPDKVWTVEIVNGTYDPTGQGYEEIVNQILASFKFTE